MTARGQITLTAVLDGESGVGIESVADEYCLSTSDTALTGDEEWTEQMPEIPEGLYLWSRSRVTYTDGHVDYVGAYCVSRAMSEGLKPQLGELEKSLAERVEVVREQAASLTERADAITGTVSDMQQALDGSTGEIQRLQGQIGQLQLAASELSLRFDTVEVDHVTTSTGYTFDAEGLDISKQGEQMHNQLTNLGMYVSRNEDVILKADASGVEATDVRVNNYLLLGRYSRFEDYGDGTDGRRTACFFVG